METSVASTVPRGFSNGVTKFLTKMETRLGLNVLNLTKDIAKESWMERVIIPDTLETFSRYIPQVIDYDIDRLHPKKDGYWYIDEDYAENVEIIGCGDVAWPKFSNSSLYYQQEMGYGTIDYLSQSSGFSFEDIAMLQMRADMGSIVNNGIFVDFIPPTRFAIKGRNNHDLNNLSKFSIKLYIKHNHSLTSIPATKMETFEKLAMADIAKYVYNGLKMFDGTETAYANIDLKLQDLENEMSKRDDIIAELKEANVSASNPACPIIMTV